MKKNTETATDAAMQSVLDAANGRATAHTLTDPSAVRRIAREAEAVLADLGLPPAHRRGARAEYVSGKGLPNAYRYKGVATRLVFDVHRRRGHPENNRSQSGVWRTNRRRDPTPAHKQYSGPWNNGAYLQLSSLYLKAMF
jgi:hypothetical protein